MYKVEMKFVSVLLCVYNYLYPHSSNTYSDIGFVIDVQLCKIHCERTVSCRSILYDATRRTCVLELSEHTVEWKNNQVSLATCPKIGNIAGFQIIKRRMESQKYLEGTTEELQKENPSKRLLIGMYDSARKNFSFLQYDLDKRVYHKYSYRRVKYPISLGYVSATKTLIVGARKPNIILSSQLDSNGGTKVLMKRIISVSIAVDQSKQLVFATTGSRRSTVERMTPSGRNVGPIRVRRTHCDRLHMVTTDSHNTIFVACRSKVISFTYDGENMQTLAQGENMKTVAFDSSSNTLYYNAGKALKAYETEKDMEKTIHELDSHRIGNMVYFENKIYFTYDGLMSRSAIHVVELNQFTHEFETGKMIHIRNMSHGAFFTLLV